MNSKFRKRKLTASSIGWPANMHHRCSQYLMIQKTPLKVTFILSNKMRLFSVSKHVTFTFLILLSCCCLNEEIIDRTVLLAMDEAWQAWKFVLRKETDESYWCERWKHTHTHSLSCQTLEWRWLQNALLRQP